VTPENFNWQRFEHGICLDAPISDVYKMIGTAEGLTQWFIGSAKFTTPENNIRDTGSAYLKNDRYEWQWKDKDHAVDGSVLEANESDLVRFTFGAPFYVTIRLSLHEDGRTKLVLEQSFNEVNTMVGEFSYVNCCVCWVFFLTNLKSVLEHDTDLRETTAMDEMLVNR